MYRTDEDRAAFVAYKYELRPHQLTFDRYRDELLEKRFRKPYLQVADYSLASIAKDSSNGAIAIDPSSMRTDCLHKTIVGRTALQTHRSLGFGIRS